MRRTLAFILVVGLSVGIAAAYDRSPRPSAVRPEEDARLAKVANACHLRRLACSRTIETREAATRSSRGGISCSTLFPLCPRRANVQGIVQILGNNKGQVEARNIVGQIDVPMIGLLPMPVCSQTIYRGEMHTYFNLRLRHDLAIGEWVRDTPDSKARLSITSDDHETRLKLKSIVPVLERGR